MSATASAPSMPPTKVLPKVLRIGVVQDGKIIQERLIRLGETVTVGESPRNTFVLTGTKLPQRHDLFISKQDGTYILSVLDWIEGKISWKDGIRGLDELRARGEATRKGDVYNVLLNENVRGKVTIGSSTFLFQFVPAPPEPVRQVTAADFRPRFFDDEDPLFHGLLGVFTLMASAFMVWVYVTPLPERADLDLIEDAVGLAVDKPIPIVTIDQPKTDDAGPEKPEPKAEAKAETKSADSTPSPDNKPAAPSKESVAKKSLLLQVIGTAGNASGENAVADLLGEESASMAGLDSALKGVSGVQEATAGNIGSVKGGSGGGREDAKVGTGVLTGGSATTGAGAAVAVKKPKIDIQDKVDADVTEGDAGSIASVVRKSQARVQTCVEQALKANPNMSGRVSVGWTIAAGKVTEAHLVSNSTGDDVLGQCIVKSVRAFRFDPSLSAEVAEFPWVVSGQ